MKTYKDFGIVDMTPIDDPKWKKVKWIEFRIVVPDEETKQQLQAAFEYLHDNKLIDTDFMAVNALVHSYLTPEREEGTRNVIIVDPDLFHKTKQKTCPHKETYIDEGMEICKDCGMMVKITSYRD